jgi:2-polyprenyl-6-methoxyphenol hydroxylase-like FAD-dependent oxidoreductase
MGEGTGVLVIGGGPAGLAAAIAARMKGLDVTVADGAMPPIDKACGEGLMPSTMDALRELGLKICPGDGQVFRGIRFVDAVTSAETSFQCQRCWRTSNSPPSENGETGARVWNHSAMEHTGRRLVQ